MTSDYTSELFPILAESEQEFEVVMRGYDRRQVDNFVVRAEAELSALTTERDSAAARSADLAAQLANAHAQIESLRRKLTETAVEITPENVHARVRPIVELALAEARSIRESADAETTHLRLLADADAGETRRAAAADAERMRGQAQADLQRATEAAQQRSNDAEAVMATAQASAAEQLNRARDEASRLLAETQAEVDELVLASRLTRDRLDADAAAKRVLANEDFEIALRVRRTEEQRVDDERHAAAVATAAKLVNDAQNESDRLVTSGRAEASRVVYEANAESARVIDEAMGRVDQLTALHHRVHADLSATHGLMGQVLDHSASIAPPVAVQPIGLDPTQPAPQPASDDDEAEAPPLGIVPPSTLDAIEAGELERVDDPPEPTDHAPTDQAPAEPAPEKITEPLPPAVDATAASQADTDTDTDTDSNDTESTDPDRPA